jgi:hypothetical protein
MKSAAGFAGYLGQVEVPWAFMGLFAAVAIGGIVAGTHLVRQVSHTALQRAFAVFLLVMGVLILYQNRGVFLPGGRRSDAAAHGGPTPRTGPGHVAGARRPAAMRPTGADRPMPGGADAAFRPTPPRPVGVAPT